MDEGINNSAHTKWFHTCHNAILLHGKRSFTYVYLNTVQKVQTIRQTEHSSKGTNITQTEHSSGGLDQKTD